MAAMSWLLRIWPVPEMPRSPASCLSSGSSMPARPVLRRRPELPLPLPAPSVTVAVASAKSLLSLTKKVLPWTVHRAYVARTSVGPGPGRGVSPDWSPERSGRLAHHHSKGGTLHSGVRGPAAIGAAVETQRSRWSHPGQQPTHRGLFPTCGILLLGP